MVGPAMSRVPHVFTASSGNSVACKSPGGRSSGPGACPGGALGLLAGAVASVATRVVSGEQVGRMASAGVATPAPVRGRAAQAASRVRHQGPVRTAGAGRCGGAGQTWPSVHCVRLAVRWPPGRGKPRSRGARRALQLRVLGALPGVVPIGSSGRSQGPPHVRAADGAACASSVSAGPRRRGASDLPGRGVPAALQAVIDNLTG
jgi:hypothetical protein